MSHEQHAAGSSARILTLGAARGPVAAAAVRVRRCGPAALAARVRAFGALRGHYEAVHLADARLAPLGRSIRQRTSLAVSVDVGPQDLVALARRPRLAAAIGALDAAFVFGDEGDAELRTLVPRVPRVRLPLVAIPAADPPEPAMRRVERALRGADPLRPIVAFAWNPDLDRWREVAGLVRVLSDAGVICIAAGVPSESAARLVRAGAGVPMLRAHVGPLDDFAVAAVARCADVFVVPWRIARDAPAADALVRIALAASGVPVVASDHATNVLAHERNAFLVREGDVRGYSASVARLLDMPARQRHFMGAEFAAWTLRRWPVAPALDAYEERLAAIAGRAALPAELRTVA